MKKDATAWTNWRKQSGVSVNWRFAAADAHIKLKRLYSEIDN
ncbi:hypothetical protein [Salinibacter altiplanensis]|nr:hypothetical protein [Salinibacter altiplanensis]